MTLSPHVSIAVGMTCAGQSLQPSLVRNLRTPGLYYSGVRLRENLAVLEQIQSLDDKIRFAYAAKACMLFPILKTVAGSRLLVEVQSLHELLQVVRAGIAAHRLIWNGPRKSTKDLEYAIKNRITVIIDSLSEGGDILRLIEDGHCISEEQLGLRVDVSEMKGYFSSHPGKLGMSREEAVSLIKSLQAQTMAPCWLHCHALARADRCDTYDLYIDHVVEVLRDIYAATRHRFEVVDLGGGIDSRSRLARHGLDISDFINIAKARLLCGAEWAPSKLCLEPGRYVVDDTAFGLGNVIRRKMRDGRQWLIVDLSTNLLVPVPLARFEVSVLPGVDGMPTSIGDGTCSPAGVLVANCSYPPAMEGDTVVFIGCGAYTASLMEPFFEPVAPIYWVEPDHIDELISPRASKHATDLYQGFENVT